MSQERPITPQEQDIILWITCADIESARYQIKQCNDMYVLMVAHREEEALKNRKTVLKKIESKIRSIHTN